MHKKYSNFNNLFINSSFIYIFYLEVSWRPDNKIAIVKKKLNGVKPSSIMVEELAQEHCDEYFSRYAEIIRGTETGHISERSNFNDENLSPEEQVTSF